MSFAEKHRGYGQRALDGLRVAIEELARERLTAAHGPRARKKLEQAFGPNWLAHEEKIRRRKPDFDGFEFDHGQLRQLFDRHYLELLPQHLDEREKKALKERVQERLITIQQYRNDVSHPATIDEPPHEVNQLLVEVRAVLRALELPNQVLEVENLIREHLDFWRAAEGAPPKPVEPTSSAASITPSPGSPKPDTGAAISERADDPRRSGLGMLLFAAALAGAGVWVVYQGDPEWTPLTWFSPPAEQGTGRSARTASGAPGSTNRTASRKTAGPLRGVALEQMISIPRTWCPEVPAFSLDATEVSVRSFSTCAKSGACTARPHALEFGSLQENQRARLQQSCNGFVSPPRWGHPVNCVTWSEAATFCRWAGKRLPTTTEWHCALRRGRQVRALQDSPDMGGNLCDKDSAGPCSWPFHGNDGAKETAKVGANGSGKFYGLVGNVSEWTSPKACTPENCGSQNHIRVGASYLTGNEQKNRLQPGWELSVRAAIASPEVGFRCAMSVTSQR